MFKRKLAYGLIALVGCVALGYYCTAYRPACQQVDNSKPDQVVAISVEDPEGVVAIEAPTYADIGELIKLKVVGGEDSTFSWKPLEEGSDFAVFVEGREAVFSARKNGVYRFVLAVSTNNRASVFIHTINVGIEPTNATEWVALKCSKIKPDKEKIAKLASSFKLVADKVNAGILTEIGAVLKATAESNKLVIAGDEKLVVLMVELQSFLKSKSDSGELATVADHAKVWLELSVALDEWSKIN